MAEDCMRSVRLPLHEQLPVFDRALEIHEIRARLSGDNTLRDEQSESGHRALLVTGPPGVGKTSLVEATFGNEIGVLCCSGKYEQYNTNPLEGFNLTISQLCQVLADRNQVVQPRQMSSDEANSLFVAFSATREAVAVSVETTEPILDQDDSPPSPLVKSDFRWGLECLKRAVANFIEEVSIALSNRIALYLDDLQWADMASIELFLHLAEVVDKTRVFLIGSCRSTHQLVITKLLDSRKVTELQLHDLSRDGVGEIVTFLTKRERGLEELAETIHSRTNGNPFHTIQFLQMLQDENYLYYSVRSNQWECHLEKIQNDTNITDNVVDVVRNSLHRLPEEVRHILFVSSFVGSHADVEVIQAIIEIDMTTLKEYLKVAAIAGLVNLKRDKQRFKFVHDRIQQEAYESNPTRDPVERERIHYQVGKFLLERAKCPTSAEDWMQPVAVSNLNQAPTFIRTFAEKLSLVDANCEAAKAMISKAAFFAAADYLRFGLGLLEETEDKWRDHYDRVLEMTVLLAEMHLCEGAFDDCYARVEEVIQSAKCLDDKLAVFCVRAEALCVEGNPSGLEIGYEMLDELGERYCRNPSAVRVGINYFKVRRFLRRKTDEQLLSLPQMKNPCKDVAQRLSSIMGLMATLAGDDIAMGHVGLNGVQIILRHGHSTLSSAMMSAYAAMCSLLGDVEGCRRFSKLALILDEMYPNHRSRVQMLFTANCFSTHLDQPMHKCLDNLIAAYDLGMRVGETYYAFFSASCYSSMYLMIGLPLGPIVADMIRFNEQMIRYGQTKISLGVRAHIQYASNLMGQSSSPGLLEGDVFDMGEHLGTPSEVGKLADNAAHDLRQMLTVHFGSPYDASRYADHASSLHRADGTLFCAPWARLYYGLAYLRMARESKWRHRYIRKAKTRCMRYFKHWMKHGILNIQQKYLLLQAELSSLHRKVDTQHAREIYNKSIRLASRTGFAADAAIANERCGDFLLHRGETGLAVDCFIAAIQIYEQMGAKAKVDQLEGKQGPFGAPSSETRRRSSGFLRGQPRYNGVSTQQHSRKFPFPEFLSSKQLSSTSLYSNDLENSARSVFLLDNSHSSIDALNIKVGE